MQNDAKFIRKFVIEFIDVKTGCIKEESVIETSDIASLCEIIDLEVSDIHPAAAYDMDLCVIEKIKLRFGIVCSNTNIVARLRSWRPIDELPYKVHTNRELALMLSGSKPLAAFSEQHSTNSEHESIPESFFDCYVKIGLFVKRECLILDYKKNITRVVLYAREGEEWRIDAYILLKVTANKTGWNEGFERIEGSLLGYEEWQIDVHINKNFNGSPRRMGGAERNPSFNPTLAMIHEPHRQLNPPHTRPSV
jgi:hypothetical protein